MALIFRLRNDFGTIANVSPASCRLSRKVSAGATDFLSSPREGIFHGFSKGRPLAGTLQACKGLVFVSRESLGKDNRALDLLLGAGHGLLLVQLYERGVL